MLPCNKRRFLDTSIKCYLETLILSLVPATWKLPGSKWEHMHGNAWKWHLSGKGWLDFRHFKAFLTPVFFNFATWHCRPQSPTALAMLLPPRDRSPNMRYPLEAKCLKRMHLGKDQMTYRYLFLVWLCVFALVSFPCLNSTVAPTSGISISVFC